MTKEELKELENKINDELIANGCKPGDIWYTNMKYRSIVFKNLGVEDAYKHFKGKEN